MDIIDAWNEKHAVRRLVTVFRELLSERTDAELDLLWEGMVRLMYRTDVWWADTWTRQLLFTAGEVVSTGIEGVSNLEVHELFALLGMQLAEDELRQHGWVSREQEVSACAPLMELLQLARIVEGFSNRSVRQVLSGATTRLMPEFEKLITLAGSEGKKAIPSAGGKGKHSEGNKKKAELLEEANNGIAKGLWATASECATDLQPRYFPDEGPLGSDDPWSRVLIWVSPLFLARKRLQKNPSVKPL
ncbi:hypothetical protein [Caenimonas sp. SL110]|uniref:hypothetical protein n=1 Tax=Caenimonas sp. SL110 TaxID=1450524 RepID=UPI0006528CE4|nr:hypothetical protein [Caenimonas sp. SL110]